MSLLLTLPLLLVTHDAGTSGGDYRVTDGVLRARLSFQRAELEPLLQSSGSDLSAALSVQLSVPGRSCEPTQFRAEVEDEDGLRIHFQAACGLRAGEVLELHLGFIEKLAAGHRHYYEARAGGAGLEGIAYREHDSFHLGIEATSSRTWLGWALPMWLVFSALSLGLGTRRRTMEVALVAVVTSVLLVGLSAAAALVPKGLDFSLIAPLFALAVAVEAQLPGSPKRRTVLAVPAGMIAAYLFLSLGLGEGAPEDRVVRGLANFAGVGLAPGLGFLALFGLSSVFWPRVSMSVVAAAAVAMLVLR